MKNLKLGVVVGGFLLCQNATAITLEYCGYLLEECERQARTQGCIYDDEFDKRCMPDGAPGHSEYDMNLMLQGHPYINTICNQWSPLYDMDAAECRIMCAMAAYSEIGGTNSYSPTAADFELYCNETCDYGEYAKYDNYLGTLYSDGGWPSAKCAKCSAGYYMDATDHRNTSCYQCEAGYAASSGSRRCHQCSAGQYSEAGWAACQCCPENTYSDDGKTCKPCPMLDDVSGVYEGTCGDGIEVCYIPENTPIHDETGTYEFTTTCWWTYY